MNAIQLPSKVGVMILPDCTLFPHGGLPLRIFEPRYRTMLQEAIEADCFFAVARALPTAGDDEERACDIGTIGMVRASHTQEDGTSHLILHGIMRVRFTRWLPGKSYPYAEIEPIPSVFHPAEQAASATATLRGFVEDAILDLPEEVQKTVMEMLNRTDDPVILADAVSHQFFHDPDQRQMLLEQESAATRIAWICRSLQT